MARGCGEGQPTEVDQGSVCSRTSEVRVSSRGSVRDDCSTNDSVSGFKTAFPMEVVSADLNAAETEEGGKVHSTLSSKGSAKSSECPLESARPKQRLYPALPVEDDPPLAPVREQAAMIGAAGSPAPFKMAVSHKGPFSESNPTSKVAEVRERDPVDSQQQLPNQMMEAGGHGPYSPDLPRMRPPSSLDKMPTPSAPPMPLPLSRPALPSGLQHEASSSPLSPMSYALNEIKSGNRDPSAIRRGLAAMDSTPVGSHGRESPASSAHTGKRQRQLSPSPSPASKVRGMTSPKKVCTILDGPGKSPSPGTAGRVSTPRGQSSEKKPGWLAKLFKS